MRKKPLSRSKKTPAVKTLVVHKTAVHYTAEYIINPVHPVTVNVIGCGGTGSQVLNSLARMNSALKALDHPGFFVRAIDSDRVTEANMGRQLFSPADVGSYKAVALVGKINRFFGTDWEAVPALYNKATKVSSANITISCVDSGPARRGIKEVLMEAAGKANGVQSTAFSRRREGALQPYQKPYYWMDFGNMQDRGQVVIGTLVPIKQPEKSEFKCVSVLPTIDKIHPDIFRINKNGEDGPSCSLAEALNKQDLFINTNLANMGLGILWKMFRELKIKHNGLYVNLQNLSVNPIKIQ